MRTPRSAAYARSAPHSRSKRTWSAIASSPAKRAQNPAQYAWRATKSSISAAVTRADGRASSAGEAANADDDAYGEPYSSGGPSAANDPTAAPQPGARRPAR